MSTRSELKCTELRDPEGDTLTVERLAPGLPARCAPDSAGEYVAQTVLEILREREVAE